jgi:hypothetical protein
MVDQPSQPLQGAPQALLSASIPTQGASQFALAVNPNEILIAVGQSRLVIAQPAVGSPPAPQALQEWFLTLAVSPHAAVVLSASLKSAIEVYEKQFGKIALDPALKIAVGAPG